MQSSFFWSQGEAPPLFSPSIPEPTVPSPSESHSKAGHPSNWPATVAEEPKLKEKILLTEEGPASCEAISRAGLLLRALCPSLVLFLQQVAWVWLFG